VSWKGFERLPQCARCELLAADLVFVRAEGPTCLKSLRCAAVKAHRAALREDHKLATIARNLFTAAADAGAHQVGYCGVDLGHGQSGGTLVSIAGGKVETAPALTREDRAQIEREEAAELAKKRNGAH
jgi:hypothetical protein